MLLRTTSIVGLVAFLSFASCGTGELVIAPQLPPSSPNAAGLAFLLEPQNAYTQHALTPVQVAVRDANRQMVADANDSVTLSLLSGAGPLEGTVSKPAVNGVATFDDLSLGMEGQDYVLLATSGQLFSAASQVFQVIAALGPVSRSPVGLAFVAQPQNANVLQTLAPVKVAVQDANGNVLSSAANTITLAVLAGPGSLIGTLTQQAVNGVATFDDLSIDLVGNDYVLSASSRALYSAASTAFSVTAISVPSAPMAVGLGFVAQPQNANVLQTLLPVEVAVQDANGVKVTSPAHNVTLSVLSGPGSLSGTLTRQAVNGVASFNDLTLATAGSGYVLQATSGTLFSAASSPFTVISTGSPPGAVGLSFVSQPQNTYSQTTLPPVKIAVQDDSGALIATATNSVSLSVQSGAGPLGGTTTRTAVNGIATFNDLTFGVAGGGYVLSATSPLFFQLRALRFR